MPAPRPAPEIIEFTRDDRGPVVTVMRRQQRDRDGWVNAQPAVDPEDIPDAPPVTRLFLAKGPQVPLISWVPGARRRNGSVEPVSLGLQHGGGPKAMLQLREQGHTRPETWRVLADHPRRGVVLAVPDDEDPDRALAWAMQAAVLLTPFALPETWRAAILSSR